MTSAPHTPAPSEPDGLASSVLELEQRLLHERHRQRRVDLLNDLAWELRITDPKRSLTLAEEACELASQLAYRRGLAGSLLNRGFARCRLGELEPARADAERADALFTELDDARGNYRARNLLGIICGEQGAFPEALEHFLETSRLCEAIRDRRGAADAYNNAALVHTYLSDYSSALELHLKALELYEELPHPEGVARTLVNIGLAYLEMGRFDDALPYLRRGLERPETREDPQLEAVTLMNAGRACAATDRLDEAETLTRESLARFEAIDDKGGMGYAFEGLAAIHVRQGALERAEAGFRQALALRREAGDRLGEVRTQLELGRLSLRQGRPADALPVLREALALALELGTRAEVYKAHQALADGFEQLGAFEQALHHHKAYAAIKDEVFNELSDRRLQGLRVTFQVAQAEKEREIFRLKNVELAHANEQKSKLLEQLERQAREDALTGLYNRRFFDARLGEAFDRARQEGHPLSVMICDVDDFKHINDTFSHQTGDQVLITLGELFRTHLRKSDTVARYGGEEFVALMPGTDQDEAVAICERLRREVEAFDWEALEPGLQVSLSMGVASDLTLENHEKLVGLADRRLYQAKRSGKNRLVAADE